MVKWSRVTNVAFRGLVVLTAVLYEMRRKFRPGPPGIPVLEVKNSAPLSVKIPENSRYENTPIHPVCKRKFIKIVIYLQITN